MTNEECHAIVNALKERGASIRQQTSIGFGCHMVALLAFVVGLSPTSQALTIFGWFLYVLASARMAYNHWVMCRVERHLGLRR